MALRGVAHTINTATGTTCDVTVSGIGGTGPLLNDIVILIANNGGSGTPTISFPAGFNAISNCPETATGGGGSNCAAASLVAGGSEPSSYRVTSTHSDFLSVQCWVFSGRSTSSPFTNSVTTTATAISGAGNQSCSLTGVTAAAGDDVLAWWGLSNNPTNAQEYPTFNTYPNNFGNGDTGPTTGAGPFICAVVGCCAQAVGAGATGTITAVINFAGSGFSTSFCGYVMSLAVGNVIPPTGSDTLTGNAPTVTPAISNVVTPAVARQAARRRWRRSYAGLLVPSWA